MKNVLITTLPFGKTDKTSINLLKKNNINYYFNPKNKKFSRNELLKIIGNYHGIICGTDKIDRAVINKAKKLKIISRVGVGLDNLDLKSLKKSKIKVTYTPGAPTQTVAEYTIGLMIYLLRRINVSKKSLEKGKWLKIFGKNLNKYSAKKATKNEIFKNCNLITIHLPITEKTRNLITKKEIAMMSNDTILINTSRGGIINEDNLYDALKKNKIYSAALDVFAKEPYLGRLRKLDNCHCTTHIASMSTSCRNKMELEAAQEIIRFFNGKQLMFQVPKKEYENSI